MGYGIDHRWGAGWRLFCCVLTLMALVGCDGDNGGEAGGTPVIADSGLLAEAGAVADTWMADVPPESMNWDWGEGVLAFSLMELAEVTGDRAYSDYVLTYVEYHDEKGQTYFWNDHLTPALSAALLMLRQDAPVGGIYQGAIDYVFDEGPRTPSGGLRHLGLLPINWIADLWVDSLFHFVPLLGRGFLLSGEQRYLDEAAGQMVLFLRNMQDPDTGLFTHAWRDAADQQVPPFEDGVFWARGNSWVIAAMVDLLSLLPVSHEYFSEIEASCLRLESALRAVQDPNTGRYHTLLLDADTYLETAGSGLITYGMARGVREGIFGDQTWEAARFGMEGLREVLEEGENGRMEVLGTSLGTNPIAFLYPLVPTQAQVDYGVGAWLLAATEFLRNEGP